MSESLRIKPSLRTFDLTVIVVSLVIGMGIFRTPVEVAQKAGTPSVFFLAWIAGAVISFIGALIFAEVGSRYPHAGGFYKIFSHCYHPVFAFMVNWITLISNASSTALVAILGSEYVAPLLLPNWEHSTAVGTIATISILILYGINMLGIKVSSKILQVLMFIKIGLLLLLISSIFLVDPVSSNSTYVSLPLFSGEWIGAFTLCFIPVFFTYGGYQQTMNFGNDITHAKRTMPKSILIGMSIVLFIYLTINYAYYHALGFEKLRGSNTLASDVAAILMGEGALRIVSVIMFFSVLAYVNVSVMSNPRVYYAMAEDKVMPKILMRVNSKTQVQQYALSLFVAFILITLFFSHSFEKLLKFVMFFDSIALISAAASIYIFRRRAKNQHESPEIFSMWGYPLLPVLYILVYASITITIFVHDPMAALTGFILFIVGWPLYHILQYIIKKTARDESIVT